MGADLLIIAFSFFVFLFCLYVFSRDDYVLLRKDISLDKVFDFAFLIALISVFSSRLFYVVLNYKPGFLNPFTFALFPYFPGLSLAGGLLGIIIGSMILVKTAKNFSYHIFDFFALSILCVLPFGFLIQTILDIIIKRRTLFVYPLEFIVFSALFLLLNKIRKNTKFSEGSLGFLILACISIMSFAFSIIQNWKNFSFLGLKDNFLFVIIFLICSSIFIKEIKTSKK
ncbi:MAG: prolipoprotein diacylglyceryl transferase [Candidatus Levybacteria bacterium]|nr:prolipoprotein diacylglyceryl transferase [Candidatus Levybacteria bacterium]